MNEQAVEGLRKDISALWEKRVRGDVSERAFQRESEARVLELCRALVRQREPDAVPLVDAPRRFHQQRSDGADDAAAGVEGPFLEDELAVVPGDDGEDGVLALEFLDVGVDDFAVFQVDRPLLAGAAREDEAARLLGIGYELDDISQVDRTQ